ncbi:uncharacterized protein [Nicotiana sylvestris]|uniref:uncharacterized protein n=1 Tax=Nicotiana sylvestris TaxID=4096 RepID=UPI00388CA1E5
MEEQLTNLTKALEKLTKYTEDRDTRLEKLASQIESLALAKSIQAPVELSKDKEKGESSTRQTVVVKEIQVSLESLIHVEQLKDFIIGTIKDKIDPPIKSSPAYAKSYTQRIDNLKMPTGYQPPKLQQFDGKGNPKQYVAHFAETCNNAGTYGDHLVKQFVCSLKGNAFDWYTDLEPDSIDSWEQLEQEFLNRLYSVRHIVSMIKLTNTHQGKYEPVIDFINRWRSLSLNYKDRLSETSGIEMCIQDMYWILRYILQGIKPKTFEELATRAHDMELSITTNGDQGFPGFEPNDEIEANDAENGGKYSSEYETENSMNVAMLLDTRA